MNSEEINKLIAAEERIDDLEKCEKVVNLIIKSSHVLDAMGGIPQAILKAAKSAKGIEDE